MRRPSAQTTASRRGVVGALAGELRHVGGGDDLDAVRREQVARERAGNRAEAALERVRLLHDERHLLAEDAHRRGDLGRDVGTAHDDDALGIGELVAQLVGVAERADVVDAVAHPALDLQAADARAGGDERPLEAELLPPELGGLGAGVEVHDRCARAHLDVVLGVPALRVDERRRPVLAAAQVALRQRRAVVGRVHLAGDEDDRAVEAAGAQLRGGVRGGDAAADQQDVRLRLAHRLPPTIVAYRGATATTRLPR